MAEVIMFGCPDVSLGGDQGVETHTNSLRGTNSNWVIFRNSALFAHLNYIDSTSK